MQRSIQVIAMRHGAQWILRTFALWRGLLFAGAALFGLTKLASAGPHPQTQTEE